MVCIIHTTLYIDSIQDIYFHRFHREINENTEGVPILPILKMIYYLLFQWIGKKKKLFLSMNETSLISIVH